MGMGGQRHVPAALLQYLLCKRLGGMDQDPPGRVWKISPPTRFDPRTVQPVGSRDTSYAIPTNSHVDTRPKYDFALLCVS